MKISKHLIILTLGSAVISPVVVADNGPWPTATEDRVVAVSNQRIYLPVLENDIGQGLELIEVNTTTVGLGSVEMDAAKKAVYYRSAKNFVGKDSFWYAFKDNAGRTNSAKVSVKVAGATAENVPSAVKVTTKKDELVNSFPAGQVTLVAMHDEVLKRRSHIYGEPDGTLSMRVTKKANKGTSVISIASNDGLKNGQLITYRAEDGNYYTDTIASMSSRSIELSSPLKATVTSGQHLWNFYYNASHANKFGYRAIADFALSGQNLKELNSGKHVFFGDSWFDNGVIADRVAEKLDRVQVINKGVGGNTAAHLLARFERDVSSQNPDVVWLISGTNDYFQGVTLAEYKSNMIELITKVHDLGAKAIVIDSSVAPRMSGSQYLTDLSHEYSAELAGLLSQ